MRPKSMATVVVFLFSTPERSSTPTPRSVRTSSVRRGRISLTAPTSVVLPTPNPPAIRILSATGSSEGAKSIDHFLENAVARARYHHGRRCPDADQPVVVEIPQQYPDDPERQVEIGCEVGDGDRAPRHAQDPLMLGAEHEIGGRTLAGGHHHGDEVEPVT